MTTTSHRTMRYVIEQCFPPSYRSDADKLRAWSLVFRLLEMDDRHPTINVLTMPELHPFKWALDACWVAKGCEKNEDAPGLALLVARHEAEVWSMRVKGRAA
jgi:hypothetical protein